MKPQLLIGHTNKDNGHITEDYPYSFKLRCKRKVWVETKPGFGQRAVYQTTNPRRAEEAWNAPKPGTYSAITLLYIDPATGYVEQAGLGMYASAATIEEFVNRFGEEELFKDSWIAKVIPVMRKVAAASKRSKDL